MFGTEFLIANNVLEGSGISVIFNEHVPSQPGGIVIRDNHIKAGDISISGGREVGEVRNNTVDAAPEFVGLDVFSAGPGHLLVENNTVRDSFTTGIGVSGVGANVAGNRAFGNGGSEFGGRGFGIHGIAHKIVGNVARDNWMWGFQTSGDGHTLEANRAIGNVGDGFLISGDDVALNGNVADRNIRFGFDLEDRGENLTFTGNTALDNSIDICGVSAVEAGNTFETTTNDCLR